MTTLQEIRFAIPGLPVAQPRHRVAVVAGHARAFGAPKEHAIHTFKAAARLAARDALLGSQCWTEPLRLSAQFVFPRPKKLLTKKSPVMRIPHAGQPDIDNLLKALLDALNGVLWVDDRQVFQVCDASRWYAGLQESPATEVIVSRGEWRLGDA